MEIFFEHFFENNKINPDKLVKDGDIIDVGEKLKVIATPGHTMGTFDNCHIYSSLFSKNIYFIYDELLYIFLYLSLFSFA